MSCICSVVTATVISIVIAIFFVIKYRNNGEGRFRLRRPLVEKPDFSELIFPEEFRVQPKPGLVQVRMGMEINPDFRLTSIATTIGSGRFGRTFGL